MSENQVNSTQLKDIVGNFILNKNNCRFVKNGDLPSLILSENGNEKGYKKIYLIRNFPFEYKYQYITVLDENMKEIGIITSCDSFEEESELLKKELDRRYYMPQIKTIYKMKEKMGFTNWTVETDYGKITFSVKDTYKNIVKLRGGRCIITDVDGNRYEIANLEQLDKSSYRKIELIV